MKNIKLCFIAVISIIIGCSNSTEPDYNKNFDSLTNLDAKSAIALGNDWKFSASKIKTHITTQEAIFEFPDGRVVKKTLPDSMMYVAIAPYVNSTHSCETHYPSSCDGEIKEKTIKVTATDENGAKYFDSNINTLKNGFFELWLPRNKNVKLQITYNNQTGSETITTKSDSRTCITTIQLK